MVNQQSLTSCHPNNKHTKNGMTLSENSSLAGANDIISIIYHLQLTSNLRKNYIFEGIFVPRQL